MNRREDRDFSIKDYIRSLFTGESDVLETIRGGFKVWLLDFVQQNAYLVFLAVYSVVRATGATVQSGSTGLLFSFGRAKKVLPPGFRILIPFLQIVRTIPTRQRTLDLPAQRVTTLDGLVYLVDANLVYHVQDVRKALIEIDDLIKGMRQMLVMSVQEVLRGSTRESLRVVQEMDRLLSESMAKHLEPWGVEVVNAGFTSITPSPVTLSLVQLGPRVESRRTGLKNLEEQVPRPLALALLGTGQRVTRRAELLRERELERRRHRRALRVLRSGLQRSGLQLAPKVRRHLIRTLKTEAGLCGVLGESGVGSPSSLTP